MARSPTAKQAVFIREYLVDLNATRAAERAGYPPKSAASQGSRLLKNAKVAAEVKAQLERRAGRVEVKADDVLRELLRLARVDIGDAFDAEGHFLPLKQMPEDVRRAISGIEVEELWTGRGEDKAAAGQLRKVKFWDKKGALELLGRHLKLFTDKVEHSGNVVFEFPPIPEDS